MEYMHHPVLAQEVLEQLSPPAKNPLMIDCTLGEGGHALLFLERYPDLRVIGLDRDPHIIEKAKKRLAPFKERFTAVNTWFDEYLTAYDQEAPSAILFDLGISIYHYEESGRGFSFGRSEDLDMRLDPSAPFSVADIVNTFREKEIADIIFTNGEERYGRRIASAICNYRNKQPITRSDELAAIIRQAVPASYRYGRIHPATRTFQALRIAVNNELDRIVPAVDRAIEILRPKGRVAVISFHSLEDRPVKHLFRKRADGCVCPPEAPRCTCGGKPAITILTKKPIVPSEQECQENPPSRSAKLRVAEKLEDYP
ncbi:MAG: 16S rRNA (cytosine(1402)-N(4))-methyltransferase RsmH [Sphaerochaetaceae bacterium]|jgi:16S rRNA (cytosine1402-N4)-methyltransferase|nr:16S rRNA (cytosine(1402)-N(4))-methyltransferase RsmH [Sphaerochaetaceae bacterium]MDD4219492.1 16S rRNA (cytosine(1402)-N(4))-methyltransferase RsmH [Sphaerochaetaceae bacterium]MDY0370947.1 16S rRNA (cytosine(1402)-N(4))-methyltransferase RsmH [Sphaerochaetaceae bacterium]